MVCGCALPMFPTLLWLQLLLTLRHFILVSQTRKNVAPDLKNVHMS